jgi:ethanolamine utilization protein EutQ (cupin superfamily)
MLKEQEGSKISLGPGFIRLENQGAFEWQVLYNEVVYVMSGDLYIEENGIQTGAIGDVFFLKEGAKIIYRTDSQTEFFYSFYPDNW